MDRRDDGDRPIHGRRLWQPIAGDGDEHAKDQHAACGEVGDETTGLVAGLCPNHQSSDKHARTSVDRENVIRPSAFGHRKNAKHHQHPDGSPRQNTC